MSFLLVGAAAIGVGAGVAKAISGGKQKKAAKAEADAAKQRLLQQKEAFKALDTSNPYKNMQNMMEDLTVNQQEAEFTRAQQQQSQANILDTMKASAGSSGVAALAQTLANQGSIDAQKSAISIGQQEAANQQAERAEASRVQDMKISGEIMKREADKSKISTLMGMEAADVSAANQMVAAADQKMWSGITGAAGAASSALMGGVGGGEGGGGFDFQNPFWKQQAANTGTGG